VVMGSIELVMRAPGLYGDYLAEAMAATEKAAEVSGLLLTYLGQSTGNHAPLDLSEACARSLPMLRAAMPAHVALHTDLPVPGPAVNGNANQLQLMLTNLVTNAWESVGELAATVRVTIRVVPGSDIPASHRVPVAWKPRDEPYACIEVVDTGCGIDGQEIDRICDPFFTSKFTGRGLGLPVVLGILHAHSGGLVVTSRRGRDSGSCFQAYLPVSAERIDRRAIPEDVEEFGETNWSGTVLVVEDEEGMRRTAKATLTQLGFSVLDTDNGSEAVELFRRHRDTIRLVLCDVTMPLMDGWETLAALRRISPGVPAILTSGYDEADVMAEDRAERPQAFLAKPYPFDALQRAIRRALR